MSSTSTYTPSWTQDPSVLLRKQDLLQWYPYAGYSPNSKSNALARFVIFTSLMGWLVTQQQRYLGIGLVCLLVLYVLQRYNQQQTKQKKQEAFTQKTQDQGSNPNPNSEAMAMSSDLESDPVLTPSGSKSESDPVNKMLTQKELVHTLKQEFQSVNVNNPMGNVLLTDIGDHPDKKPAPPAFTPQVLEQIDKAVKKQVQRLHPDIEHASKQLYGDMYDQDVLNRQQMRQFFSTANSQVVNDQGAFAQFLYGDMYSAKADGVEGALMRVKDNPRYNLY